MGSEEKDSSLFAIKKDNHGIQLSPANGKVIAPDFPPERKPISEKCLCCSEPFTLPLLQGKTREQLFDAIERFVLINMVEYRREYNDAPIMLHGSYGLYARAAAEYGANSPMAWQQQSGLPRHGDIDFIAGNYFHGGQFAQYLVSHFSNDALKGYLKYPLETNQLFTVQQEQKVDGQPVTGYLVWFVLQGCRRPKFHQVYKLDISIRLKSDNGSVIVSSSGEFPYEVTLPIVTWEQFWEELERDQRDGNQRSLQRLVALEKAELASETASWHRLDQIKALIQAKMSGSMLQKAEDQEQSESEQVFTVVPELKKNHRENYDSDDDRDSWPDIMAFVSNNQLPPVKSNDLPDSVSNVGFPQTLPSQPAGSMPQKNKQVRASVRVKGVEKSDFMDLLFQEIDKDPILLSDDQLSHFWTLAAAYLKEQTHMQSSQKQEFKLFLDRLANRYPGGREQGWQAGIQSLLLNHYQAAQGRTPQVIYLARQLSLLLKAEGIPWLVDDFILIRNQRLSLQPLSECKLPKALDVLLKKMEKQSSKPANCIRSYSKMLILANRVLNRVRETGIPTLVISPIHQHMSYLVLASGYCKHNTLEQQLKLLGTRSDIVVLDHADGVRVGCLAPSAQMYATEPPKEKPVNVVLPFTQESTSVHHKFSHQKSSDDDSSSDKSVATTLSGKSTITRPFRLKALSAAFDQWALRSPSLVSGLNLYRSITLHLLKKPESTQFHKYLKKRKDLFDFQNENVQIWLSNIQQFLLLSFQAQRDFPETLLGEFWRSQGNESGFLPGFFVPEAMRAIPFETTPFALPTLQANSYRDAVYILWVVLSENTPVRLLGRDKDTLHEQLVLTPDRAGGLSLYRSSWPTVQDGIMTLWIGPRGYISVDTVESVEKAVVNPSRGRHSRSRRMRHSIPVNPRNAVILKKINRKPQERLDPVVEQVFSPSSGELSFKSDSQLKTDVQSELVTGHGSIAECPPRDVDSSDRSALDVLSGQMSSLSIGYFREFKSDSSDSYVTCPEPEEERGMD